MLSKSKRLTVLSEAERIALYGLPDFDDVQRMEYFIFTEQELALALGRPALPAQVYWESISNLGLRRFLHSRLPRGFHPWIPTSKKFS